MSKTEERRVLKNIPRKEERWTSGVVNGVERFVITSNRKLLEYPNDSTVYYLYEIVDGGYIKIMSSKNPQKFDSIMFGKGVRK